MDIGATRPAGAAASTPVLGTQGVKGDRAALESRSNGAAGHTGLKLEVGEEIDPKVAVSGVAQPQAALAEKEVGATSEVVPERGKEPAAPAAPKRRLHGHIDQATATEIVGWVWDPTKPKDRIKLELLEGGVCLAKSTADLDRPGLAGAGIGDGRHAFRILLRPGQITGGPHTLHLRCAQSAAPVPGSPIVLQGETPAAPIITPDKKAQAAKTEQAAPKPPKVAPVEFGYCDFVTATKMEGWACDPSAPDAPLTMDAFVDGTYLMKVECNRPRYDAKGKPTRAIGFRVDFPPHLQDGSAHSVAFRKPGGEPIALRDVRGLQAAWHIPVASKPPPLQASALPVGPIKVGVYSGLITVKRNLVEGWIYKDNFEGPIEIAIIADGVKQWQGLARRTTKVGLNGSASDKPFGFKVLLGDPKTPTNTRLLEIKAADGTLLLGCPYTVPYGDQYLGFVEAIEISTEALKVTGWCIDAVHPSGAVPLEVQCDGKVLGNGLTNLHRSGMSVVGFDAPYAGFSITVPLPEGVADLSSLVVRPGLSLTPLERLEGLELTDTRTKALTKTDSAPQAVQYCKPGDIIEGTIDQVTRNFIRGWARNKTNPEAIVVLDCYLDGILFATVPAQRFRADLKKHFDDHGCHEYLIELSPTTGFFNPGKIQVLPRVGTTQIKQKIEALENYTRPNKTTMPRETNFMRKYRVAKRGLVTRLPRLSLIVINKNGAELLSSFFQSFYEINTYKDYEILIIDHQSTDASEAVALGWKRQLNVMWLPRDSNYSFSSSNNYGVEKSTGDVLIFVNNDITFHQDILAGVVAYLDNPGIGCVGIKLFDDSPVPRQDLQHPIQHLGIHFGPTWRGASVEAFESRYAPMWHRLINEPVETPGVTGAFMACRREDFLRLAGFDERYFYGFEDVDLCLKYLRSGASVVAANDLAAAHLRGYSRTRMEKRYSYARERNKDVFNEEWGFWLRRRVAEQRYDKPGFWTATPLRIAFVVTEATETTLAGDYFTALELAGQLSAQFPCECTYLEVLSKNEHDLAGFDVVIAMRDDYDPRKIKDATPHLIRVAWVRNWFERFTEREGAGSFDVIWASSQSACDYIAEKLGKPVLLLPIATNAFRFKAGKRDESLKSDYCFTGSYWNLNREIVQLLDPAGLPFECAIFGTGWDAVPHLAPYSRGAIPYKRMPEVYASTKIVMDDANHVTKAWGAVNSRVFDALCAGALVITNGKAGAENLFEGLLPTFETPQGLQDLLWLYLTDESARLAKVAELQKFVLERHTYQERAKTVWREFARVSREQLRISIKIGAPNAAVCNEWGDYHFAASMKYYFEQAGHSVRIDCLDHWYAPACVGDDAVIVLRGLTRYKLTPSQINLMWNISHPDTISDAEYQEYDHVFIASEPHAASLKGLLGEKVSVLLQCTDPRFFNPDVPLLPKPPGALFVGNSRNVLRRIVADGISAGLPLEIYGTRWEGLIPDRYLVGENIPNRSLGSYYRSASVMLNDHWDTMREAGFISNRLFDGVACGARIISDDVPGMGALFSGVVRTYRDAGELAALVEDFELETAEDVEARLDVAGTVMREHGFANRAAAILAVVQRLVEIKTEPFVPGHEVVTIGHTGNL